MIKPRYTKQPITSLEALGLALGFEVQFLEELASRADDKYRKAKPIKKPDGSIRQPWDALEPLKEVHRRITSRILSKVEYPPYLTGSLKGRDYKLNAGLHTGCKIVVCEDISNFFPATKVDRVFQIWHKLLGFTPDVATLLAKLTTKNGELPQGAIPSSYLANLTFWSEEPLLVSELSEIGISYSRYVDDITVSSKRRLSGPEKSKLIKRIYSMLLSAGYKPKRRKQEIKTSGSRMMATKLVVNKKPSLTREERQKIRSEVDHFEKEFDPNDLSEEAKKRFNQVMGKVVKLQRFHPSQASALKLKLNTLRAAKK